MISAEEFLKEHERSAQSIATTRPLFDPAQVYAGLRDAANRGWRVFPIPPAYSRHALVTRDRIAEGTSNLVTLEEMADANSGYRWGLATGQASGVFVLEVEGALGRVAVSRFVTLYVAEFSDCQTLTSRAGESLFSYFRYPVGLVLRQGGRYPSPGLRIHGDGDFVLLPPSRYSSKIAHEYLNPDESVATAPQWLLDLAFEAAKEESVSRIPPHRAEPDFMPGFAKHVAKAESQNFGRNGWPAFGQTSWRRKVDFPRRA